MAEGQIQRQVVGMTMPDTGALWVDQREGCRPPPQPRTFSHESCSDGPLPKPGGCKRPITKGQITKTSPDGLWNQGTSRKLQQLRHPGQHGQNHRQQKHQQPRKQPDPATWTEHQGHGQHSSTPAISRISQIKRSQLSEHQQQQDRLTPTPAIQPVAPSGHNSSQQQRPAKRQPGRGDIGVIKQPGKTSRRMPPGGHMPDDQLTKHLPGPAPAKPKLTETAHHHRHRASYQQQRDATSRFWCRHIGLKAPEAPEKRDPVHQTNPGQPTAAGEWSAQHDQNSDQQEHTVEPITPPGATQAPTALKQSPEQGQNRQQKAAGQ